MKLEKRLNAQERVIEDKINKAKNEIVKINNPVYLNILNSILSLWENYARTPEGFEDALELYENSITQLIKIFKNS